MLYTSTTIITSIHEMYAMQWGGPDNEQYTRRPQLPLKPEVHKMGWIFVYVI